MKHLRTSTLPFSYLNFDNHPRGKFILESLMSHGFIPRIVVEEVSERATEVRAGHLSLLGEYAASIDKFSVKDICREHEIEHITVNNLNSARTAEILSNRSGEYAILGDVTRILNKTIINAVDKGIINVHPGLLPAVRGNSPYIWAILFGLPQGVSVHFIDPGVDTGPLILCKELPDLKYQGVAHLMYEINRSCANAIVEAVNLLVSKSFCAGSQPSDGNKAFTEAPAEAIRYADLMLAGKAPDGGRLQAAKHPWLAQCRQPRGIKT